LRLQKWIEAGQKGTIIIIDEVHHLKWNEKVQMLRKALLVNICGLFSSKKVGTIFGFLFCKLIDYLVLLRFVYISFESTHPYFSNVNNDAETT
jgi:hypothetical protein